MILFVMTTEGASREDGNIYYATHLLVDVIYSAANVKQVNAALGAILATDSAHLTIIRGHDAEADRLFDSPTELAATLTERGFPTAVIDPIFIVQEEE